MDNKTTLDEFLRKLQNKTVTVNVSSIGHNIRGKLIDFTYKGGKIEGIVLDRWGWLKKKSIDRIAEYIPVEPRPEYVANGGTTTTGLPLKY
jgi:hypothetical protein